MEPADLNYLRGEARRLAEVLGVAPAAAAAGALKVEWVFSDTAYELFGKVVPDTVLAAAEQM
eukprot:9298138-Alexandrium_andersonii.AAC.1